MGSITETTNASNLVRLSSDKLGVAQIDSSPPDSLQVADQLLQKNHEKWHMYFKDIAGHNHIPHSVLTVLAMGGGVEQVQRAYDDGEVLQRPIPALAPTSVDELHDPKKFLARAVKLDEYTNYLVFFEKEIDAKGWKAVINEYLFSGTEVAEFMFVQLFEGLYHPLIHLGFGVEFEQPSIIAEGLAHAATHHPGLLWERFFKRSEELAKSGTVKPKPLAELYHEIRADSKLKGQTINRGPDRSPELMSRASDELAAVAAQFQVLPADLERANAEHLSTSAYTTAAQKAGKVPKVDFFYLHLVTSGLFIDILTKETWIKLEDRVRLLEWKARMDLTWYAACGAPELRSESITDYKPTLSAGMDWRALYKASNDVHDDGHVVKFIRAIKNAQDVVRPFEGDVERFPVSGDTWFKIAQLCYDGSAKVVDDKPGPSKKWVWAAGFEASWDGVPNL